MNRPTLFPLFLQLLWLQSYTQPAFSSFLRGDNEIKALGRPHHKIFHPPLNSCIFRNGYGNPLTLAPCTLSDSWNYTPQKFLIVVGTYFCLKAVGPSLSVELNISCSVSDSQWNIVSDSGKTHFSTNLDDGTMLCLDVDNSRTIVTNACQSFSKGESASFGDRQWFQINTFSNGKYLEPIKDGE